MATLQPAPTSHSFNSQRTRLHYLDWGNIEAPLVILQHGGRDHAHSWDWVARELCRDWHVIAPDLRGHGDSAWSPDGAYIIPYYVYDFTQLIDQLGVEQVSIISHSLGGNVATRYTGLFPEKVRRLVNIEGLGPAPQLLAERAAQSPDESWHAWLTERHGVATRQAKRYKSIDDAFARMRAENTYLSAEQARHLTIYGIARNEDGTWSWKFDNYVHSYLPWDIPQVELEYLWHRITCPVLLMHGAKSWAPNPAENGKAAHFRNARVVSFEHSGHWPHHDQFNDFMLEIKAFL